ncbi:MAG: hypothetical protein KW804_01935 [Candidatus Doudnabacteria bacterium]|nr:hypothetical protein [Candidatus Doudnabacteria bacterium]
MDPRRKKIYIILICLCFGISISILLWTFVFNNPDDGRGASEHIVVKNTTPREASGNPAEGFNAPSVFPTSATFKFEVLQSEAFLKLKEYTPLDVTDQLGRPDPFMTY